MIVFIHEVEEYFGLLIGRHTSGVVVVVVVVKQESGTTSHEFSVRYLPTYLANMFSVC